VRESRGKRKCIIRVQRGNEWGGAQGDSGRTLKNLVPVSGQLEGKKSRRKHYRSNGQKKGLSNQASNRGSREVKTEIMKKEGAAVQDRTDPKKVNTEVQGMGMET